MTVTGYSFRLYLAGGTARAMQAEAQLRHLCETRLPEGFELEVLDVTDHPDRAEEDRVLVTPTVIRLSPPPARRVLGSLSDEHRVGLALGLPAVEEPPGDRSRDHA